MPMPHLSAPSLPESAQCRTMAGQRLELPASAADEADLHAAVARCRRYVRDAVVATLQEAVMHTARASEAARGEQVIDAAREDVDVDEEVDAAAARTQIKASAAASSASQESAASASSSATTLTSGSGAASEADEEAAARQEAAAKFALFKLRAISASTAYQVYAVAAQACVRFVEAPLASSRRHPRVQGWAVMSGACPQTPLQTSTALPPLLPPLSAVPRLTVAAAMRVAECLAPGQVVRECYPPGRSSLCAVWQSLRLWWTPPLR